MAKPHVFTRQEIVTLLRSSPQAVARGIMALYERQLEDERSAGTARARNRSGFSISTAPDGTRIAQQLMRGQALSASDLQIAQGITEYHAGQLARIATELEAVRVKARETERREMHRSMYSDLVQDVERVLGRPVDRTKFNQTVTARARRNGDTSPEGMIGAGQEILEELQDKMGR